jgi:predicted enzyme related to lactoylglutathione lyase
VPKIVVSYRRSDSSGQAGRIYDHLLSHFGEGAVFMDVDAIPFGTDFRTHIRSELLLSDILLAVIGPRWLGTGADGSRRIDDEADPVRVEVETALKHGIAIVPVLIDGTPMPGASKLPEALKELAFLNAAPVDMGRDFRSHMDRLVKALGEIIANRRDQVPTEGQSATPLRVEMATHPCVMVQPKPARPWLSPLVIVGSVLIAAGLGAAGWRAFKGPPQVMSSAAPPATAGSARAADGTLQTPSQQPAAIDRPVQALQRSKLHGTFAWYELWTTNAAAAQNFYRSVIGWDTRTSGHSDAAYTMLLAGQVPVAGMATLPAGMIAQGARSSWVGYVSVTDVDASTAEVKALGGAIYRMPADVAGIGRYSLVADPQGAYIVLFKGLTEIAPPVIPRSAAGYGGWRELSAVDRDGALGFYQKLFGWTKVDTQDLTSAGTQLFAVAGTTIGDIRTKPANVPLTTWTYFFQVERLSAAMSRVQAVGGTIVGMPTQMHDGSWSVQALDPQGATFALISQDR